MLASDWLPVCRQQSEVMFETDIFPVIQDPGLMGVQKFATGW